MIDIAGRTAFAEFAKTIEVLTDDLGVVEAELAKITSSGIASVATLGTHLQTSGGKRIRPTLLLLSARLFGYPDLRTFQLAAIVEAIHTATLVHDDVIDDAATRRGRPSTNMLWGNARSVLAGDWLFMQAFRIALSFRHFTVLDVLIELTQRMVEGELAQLETLGRIIPREQYFELVACKTAALFSGCSRLGAMTSGASGPEQNALASYGQNLGMAFQIVDDVLDLTASERVLGKPTARDLREGKATLPILHAYASATSNERHQLETVLRDRGFETVGHADVIKIVERYGSIDASLQVAQTFAEIARRAVADFAESDAKRALMSASELIVNRKF